MNVIPFQSLDMYEFFCDSELIDRVMTDVAGPDIIWKTTGSGDGSSKEGYLDNEVPYYHSELFNWMQECIDKVAEKHYFDVKLSIVDSWLTKNQFGEHPNAHDHKHSVVSGLLYFSTFKKSKTTFVCEDPWHKHVPMMLFPTKEFTVTPEKGKLILWRSDIVHSIQPHTDMKNTRYTLAFNTFFDGVISDRTTAKLQLKVKSVKDQYEEYIKNKND